MVNCKLYDQYYLVPATVLFHLIKKTHQDCHVSVHLLFSPAGVFNSVPRNST